MEPIILRIDDTRTIRLRHCYGDEIEGISVTLLSEMNDNVILYIECAAHEASLLALAFIRSQIYQ